jgi:hypothetical protein
MDLSSLVFEELTQQCSCAELLLSFQNYKFLTPAIFLKINSKVNNALEEWFDWL